MAKPRLAIPVASGSNLLIRQPVLWTVGGFDLQLTCNEDSRNWIDCWTYIFRKRQIIELLDVQAKLSFEKGERVVVLSCALGREAMFIVSPNTCRPEHNLQDIFIVSSRIPVREKLSKEVFSYAFNTVKSEQGS